MDDNDLSSENDAHPNTYNARVRLEILQGKTRISILGTDNEVCLVRAWLSTRVPGLRLIHDTDGVTIFEEDIYGLFC